MHRLNLQVSPKDAIDVPNSDGYSVYGALLSVLHTHDPELAAEAHDKAEAMFHNSGLIGEFGDSSKDYHKTIEPDETYRLVLGFPQGDDELFTAFNQTLGNQSADIPLNDGELTVERASTKTSDPETILEQAGRAKSPDLRFNFKSPICIEEYDEITSLFPKRREVFLDLQRKWNRVVPEEHQFDLTRDQIGSQTVEKSKGHIPTYNVVINRTQTRTGEKNIFRHGFGGGVTYTFRGADRDTMKKVTALALFAPYSGIGVATARGCGSVDVSLR